MCETSDENMDTASPSNLQSTKKSHPYLLYGKLTIKGDYEEYAPEDGLLITGQTGFFTKSCQTIIESITDLKLAVYITGWFQVEIYYGPALP